MKNQNIAVETYKYFSTLEGNQHIASVFALKKIIDIIENYKIKNVLELGLGIGSISYSVLEYSRHKKLGINYVGTESNDFCLEVLPKYLKVHFDKIQIFRELNEVICKEKFDLVIIDGQDKNLIKVKEIISHRGVIVIEGDRKPQLEIVKSVFSKHLYTRIVSNQYNPNYGPCAAFYTSYVGGLQLIFINPNLCQKINHMYYKINTAIKYKIRDVKTYFN